MRKKKAGRLLVCGRRDWKNRDQVLQWIKWLNPKTVIHGGARGADTFAGEAARALDKEVIVFPANWKTQGKAAGAIRNQQMLDEGKPDRCLAFDDGQGRGTADMIRRCRSAGIPVIVVRPHTPNPNNLWRSSRE
jgi:hypothetical protein